MSPIWPTAAAACSSCSAWGRGSHPRRCMPAAMAPLETSTTSRPDCRSWAISPAQRDRAPRSRPRPLPVTRPEPTLTTRRFAFSRTELMGDSGSFPAPLLLRLRTRRVPGAGDRILFEVFHDGERELAAAFAGERGNDKAFAFPAQSLEHAPRGGCALVGGKG